MIKASELRKGNYFTKDGEINKVMELLLETVGYNVSGWGEEFIDEESGEKARSRGGCYTAYDKINPIPLTPETLEMAGFIRNNNYCYYEADVFMIRFKFKKNNTIWASDVCGVKFGVGYSSRLNSQMLYLHQLQNLYFALRGEELDIKL